LYCEDNAKKLSSVVNKIIRKKWATLPTMYHDDFLDIAFDTLVYCANSFDDSKDTKFETFLCGSLQRKFITNYTYETRGRRCNVERDENGKIKRDKKKKPIVIPDVYLDAPIGDEGNLTIGDTIPDRKNIEDIIFPENLSSKVEKYIAELPRLSRKIIVLKMDGDDKNNIIGNYISLQSNTKMQ